MLVSQVIALFDDDMIDLSDVRTKVELDAGIILDEASKCRRIMFKAAHPQAQRLPVPNASAVAEYQQQREARKAETALAAQTNRAARLSAEMAKAQERVRRAQERVAQTKAPQAGGKGSSASKAAGPPKPRGPPPPASG